MPHFTEDAVDEDALVGVVVRSCSGVANHAELWLRAAPDFRLQVSDVVTGGRSAAVRWTISGTLAVDALARTTRWADYREFLRVLDMSVMCLVPHGLISHCWDYWDAATLLSCGPRVCTPTTFLRSQEENRHRVKPGRSHPTMYRLFIGLADRPGRRPST
ncbi:nuclear transport factor 2 family protein [Lentzea sp. DG1S-22]|uniref:nuclear transport factor 2 family protein n=1 Tax=Lentzea sp. DG1S-22 TaxID=3108822 RepID=UPI003FA5BF8A